jgi:hypothetical protein
VEKKALCGGMELRLVSTANGSTTILKTESEHFLGTLVQNVVLTKRPLIKTYMPTM